MIGLRYVEGMFIGGQAFMKVNEQYIDAIQEQWHNILKLYKMFEDKKPIMEFDIQHQKIYAYPFKDYKAGLSKRSQAMIEKQYKEAFKNNKVVVFVKDNEKRKLISVSLDIEKRQ